MSTVIHPNENEAADSGLPPRAGSASSMPPQRRLRLALQETIAAEEAAQEEMRGLREKNGWLTHKLDQVEIHIKAIQAGKFDAKECTAFLLREFFPPCVHIDARRHKINRPNYHETPKQSR